MLLHMVLSSLPVNPLDTRLAGIEWRIGQNAVNSLAALSHHTHHLVVVQGARVMRLATALGEEDGVLASHVEGAGRDQVTGEDR